MIRNAQVFRLDSNWGMTSDRLEELLATRCFVPCSSQERKTSGWVRPGPGDAMVHVVGGQWLLSFCEESKLLPASVVKRVVDERAQELAAQQGFKPGRKQLKELRDEVEMELLPRAFTRRTTTFAWIDPVNGWVVVDAPSRNRAEDVLHALRDVLPSFPISNLRTRTSPSSAMAGWLSADEPPEGFTLDQDCELRSFTDERATVRYSRLSLERQDVKDHLAEGKMPSRLALTFDDRVSFALTDSLEFKRIALLDVLQEEIGEEGEEDVQALFDANFLITARELDRLFTQMIEALGGEEPANRQ